MVAQQPGDLVGVVLLGDLQRGPARQATQRGVRPELQQRPRGGGLTLACCPVQRSAAVLVLRIELRDVRAAQRPDELHVIEVCRHMQRGHVVLVRPAHVRAIGRQQVDGGPRGALPCGEEQRGVLAPATVVSHSLHSKVGKAPPRRWGRARRAARR